MEQNRTLIAMSGGVDSSAAAVLLQHQQVPLLGATLDLRFPRRPGDPVPEGESPEAADAKAVCSRLGIDHLTLPMGEQFRQRVVQPFVDSYLRGDTPNPCVDCNLRVKFGLLLEAAEQQGCTAIATGHYARNTFDPADGRWKLSRGADPRKDQTYVLWRLTQPQLARIRFPLGDSCKEDIRSLAEQAGLEVAAKPDSQDICFIPDGDYGAFLEDYLGYKLPEGNYLDRTGKVLGRHKGMARYTMGQRKGLGIALGAPAYVITKDPTANTVTLGREEDLYCTRFLIREPNWIAVESLTGPTEVTVKTRYTQRETEALLHPRADGLVLVELARPERAVTPGQSAVFYSGDLLFGGGFILNDCD